jgi:hypothetical protein
MYYNLEGTFDGCEVSHISRSSNEKANNLTDIGSRCLPIPIGVLWKETSERSVKTSKPSGHQRTKEKSKDDAPEPEDVMMIEVTWMQPYLAYIINKQLSKDVVKVRRITRRSKAFVIIDFELNLYIFFYETSTVALAFARETSE